MSKHTPGPWTVNTCWSQTCGDGYTIEEENADDIEGNACLIAAAPDLLAACKTVKAFLDRLEDGVPLDDDPLRAIRIRFHAPLHTALDSAIAKAEGSL